MKKLSSIELSYLVKELQILVGSKVDKIYDFDDEIVFGLHLPNTGKKFLRILPGKFIFLTEIKEAAENPSGFAMNLRKHLSNARIREIKQLLPERIVEIIFEKDKRKKLFVEMFSNGNVVLCDDTEEIISAQIMKSWKDRTVKPKVKYAYPKSRVNFFNLSFDEMKGVFSSTEKNSIVTSLAIDFGFGGVFAEEICLIANVDKNLKPNEINIQDVKKILDAVHTILNKKIISKIFLENGSFLDAVPFSLDIYKDFESRDFLDYSSALEFYYNEFYLKEKNKDSKSEKEIRKILAQIKTQEESIKELAEKITEETRKTELIYENYSILNEILSELKKASKKFSWQEIRERLKEHKIVKEVDPKEKSVVVEI